MFQNNKQLILKVTRGCNLRCSYCYVFDKEKYDDEVISDETFNNIIECVFRENNYYDVPKDMEDVIFNAGLTLDEKKKRIGELTPFSIVFHGGEPLRIGKEKFSKFCKIASQKAREYGKFIQLAVQTNGTLIDPEWAEIFRRYEVSVGISWDGYGESSDNRSNSSSVYNNIALLMTHGIIPGIITILNKKNYKYITQTLKMLDQVGCRSIKINRGVDVVNEDVSKSDYELNADELLETSIATCNYMFLHKDGIMDDVMYNKMLKFLDNLAYGLKIYRKNICYTRYCGAGNAILEVEPDGTVLMCGRNSLHHSAVAFNIFNKDICELKAIQHMWDIQKKKVDSVNDLKCNLCNAQPICDYGCLSFSYQKFDGKAKIDPITCQYNKKLYAWFSQHFDEIIKYCDKGKKSEPYLGYFL